MRLVSFVPPASIRPRLGIRRGTVVTDVHATDASLPSDLVEFLALDAKERSRANRAVEFGNAVSFAVGDVSLCAPVLRPGKIIALGLNYRSHLEEVGMDVPSEPSIFSKFGSSVIGPHDAVELPMAAPSRVDWEAELAVVIGQTGRDIDADAASDFVAGYMVANDVTARDWQVKKPGGQWLLGKSFDTFLPLGPELVTPDELDNLSALRVSCTISGERMQDATLGDMLFGIEETIAYVSRVCTLEPGDVILTGTPSGIGAARSPRRFLQAGDVIETMVEQIGSLINPVRLASAAPSEVGLAAGSKT